MSAVPKRKPVSLHSVQELEGALRNDADTPPLGVNPNTLPLQEGGSDTGGTDHTSQAPNDETLVLSKAKVEQLAYLLLDLVGSAPEARFRLQGNHDGNYQSSADALSAATRPTQPGRKMPAVMVREMLKPSDHNSEQVSRLLLQRKPWAYERIAVDVQHADHTVDQDDIHVDIGTETDTNHESFPLTSARPPMSTGSTLQEKSLYMIQGRHAWTDLNTRLGPGRFTEEGQQYWLSRRPSEAWPRVIPSEKRAHYLMQLWAAMTIQIPRSNPEYDIVSDLANLAKETHFFRAYKQYFAEKIVRRPTDRQPQMRKSPKAGYLKKTTSKLQAISRDLFRTTDSARSRLPSTLYLRILGQNLFKECLPVNEDNHGEVLLQILIASLRALAEKPTIQRGYAESIEATQTTSISESTGDDPSCSTSVWDLLSICYRTNVLQQPLVGDDVAIWQHVTQLFSALQLVNIFTPHLNQNLLRSIPLDVLLSSEVQSVCAKLTLRSQESVYPGENFDYIRKKELSVQTLQDIGGLGIVWTRYIDDHLTLDTNSREVRIFWPAWALANLPCIRLFSPNPVSEIFQDLLATYSFLFYSQDGLYAAIRDYNNVVAPSWLASMNTPLSDLTQTQHRRMIDDTRYHLAFYAHANSQEQFENKNLIRFDACGIFENRARILKSFMDSQKPTDLIALWRDKRDSLQWYTFWLVLVVGGMSIFIGLASLAVSIAQTAATFEALAIQKNSTGPTPASNLSQTPPKTTVSL